MTLFKNYTYAWWQIGIFKLCLLAIGIGIGTYWHEVFASHLNIIVAVAVITTLYILSISFKQAR